MNRFISLITLLISTTIVSGQIWKLGPSVSYKINKPSARIYCSNPNDTTFIFRAEDQNFYEEIQFDSNFNLRNFLNGQIASEKGREVLFRTSFNTGWIVFTSNHNSLFNQSLMVYKEVDGKRTSSRILYDLPNKYVNPKDIRFNLIDEKIIIWIEWHGSAHQNKEVTIIDFNKNTEALEIHQIIIPKPHELVQFYDCRPIAKDKYAFTGRLFTISPKLKRGKNPNYTGCVAIYNAQNKTTDLQTFTPTNRFVLNLKTVYKRDTMYACYSSANKIGSFMDSIHLLVYNLSSASSIFEKQLGVQNLQIPKSRETFDVVRKKYKNLWVDHLLVDKEKITLVLEFFETRVVGGAGNRTMRTYYYGPVVFLNFDNIGAFISSSVIIKHQTTENDNAVFSSYRLIKDSNHFTIFYNEMDYPLKKRNILGMRRLLNSKSFMVKNTIDINGECTKSFILNNMENHELPIVRKAIYLTNGQLVLILIGKKYMRFVSLAPNN